MKTKYERMNKDEKKIIKDKFKKEKYELYKKFNRMYVLIIVGIVYSIGTFVYDFFYKKNTFNYILDIIILVFCILAFIKVFNTKKNILNDISLKK